MCTGMLDSTQAHVFSDYLYFYTRNKTSFFSFHKNQKKKRDKNKRKTRTDNVNHNHRFTDLQMSIVKALAIDHAQSELVQVV
jgi:hypothetical protein